VSVVTISDEHTPPLTVSDEAGWEGSSLMFTVRLSVSLDYPVTVSYATQSGGLFSGAIAGEDYVAAIGTLTFAPGETEKTITVEMFFDGLSKYDEYFNVRFSNVSTDNVLLAGGGLGTIYGDDGPSY
jgi:fibronectin-binding autotransporter adhesin